MLIVGILLGGIAVGLGLIWAVQALPPLIGGGLLLLIIMGLFKGFMFYKIRRYLEMGTTFILEMIPIVQDIFYKDIFLADSNESTGLKTYNAFTKFHNILIIKLIVGIVCVVSYFLIPDLDTMMLVIMFSFLILHLTEALYGAFMLKVVGRLNILRAIVLIIPIVNVLFVSVDVGFQITKWSREDALDG